MWYIQTALVSFRRRLTYRTATLAGLFTNMFFGILRAYVFLAVLKAKGGDLQGYTATDLCTYTGLTQVMLSFLMVFGWWDLTTAIKTGEITTDYCKPVGIFSLYQAKDLGRSLHDLMLRGVPLFLGYSLFLPIVLPREIVGWALFFVSSILAWMLSFSWRFLTNAIGFWTLDVRGVGSILFTLSTFMMGFLVPVPMFPHWLRRFAEATPFPLMLQTPLDIYMGRISGPSAASALADQLIWLALTTAAALFMLRKGHRRLVTQGG